MSAIIALEGDPNTGKSMTINILYDLMAARGYTLLKDRNISNSKDFYAIFERKRKKIGITSYGDSVRLIINRLDMFTYNRCNIKVCASRMGGPIKLAVENYHSDSHEFITKSISGNFRMQQTYNNNDAELIFSAIEALL